MELSVGDRIVLLGVLGGIPNEGTALTLRVVRDLKQALGFTEAEHAALKFENLDDGGIRWDESAEITKEVEVGPVAREIIADQFKALDNQKRLHVFMLDMYDKFVEETDNAG